MEIIGLASERAKTLLAHGRVEPAVVGRRLEVRTAGRGHVDVVALEKVAQRLRVVAEGHKHHHILVCVVACIVSRIASRIRSRTGRIAGRTSEERRLEKLDEEPTGEAW